MDDWSKNIATALWEKVRVYPYSAVSMNDFAEKERILHYSDLCSTFPRPRHLSAYRHLINVCEANGVSDISTYISFLCSMDYILGYPDRTIEDILFIKDDYGGVADILPCYTPYCMKFDLPYHMFSSSPESNILIAGIYEGFDLNTLDEFPEEADEYMKNTETYLSEEKKAEILTGLRSRIAFIKREARHNTYSLDWKHRERDEIRYFLRKQELPETDDDVSDVMIAKQASGEDAENCAALIGNSEKNSRLMAAIEGLRL